MAKKNITPKDPAAQADEQSDEKTQAGRETKCAKFGRKSMNIHHG